MITAALVILGFILLGGVALLIYIVKGCVDAFADDDAAMCTECDDCAGVTPKKPAPRQRVTPNVLRLASRAERKRREVHQVEIPNGRAS